ncbi:hypothetical protein [Psychrobacter sp. AOP7-A1-24]|uniref:hypothetical protein n=1 Tax=Psychrobacter sp. AOP7-A1-24 TaxID=3457646 RepID=UPI00402B603F
MIDTYTAAFLAAITPQIFVAMMGGIVGTNISSDIQLYGLRLTILTAIITLAMVGVSSEYMSVTWGNYSLLGHLLLGGIVGMSGMRLLDALRLALPELMHSLIELAGKSTLELVTALFNKAKKIIGL